MYNIVLDYIYSKNEHYFLLLSCLIELKTSAYIQERLWDIEDVYSYKNADTVYESLVISKSICKIFMKNPTQQIIKNVMHCIAINFTSSEINKWYIECMKLKTINTFDLIYLKQKIKNYIGIRNWFLKYVITCL